MLEPANTIITKLGGPVAVAKIVNRDQTRVRRWTWSKERGGTGGKIPADQQHVLLAAGLAMGVDIDPGDFFDDALVQRLKSGFEARAEDAA